MAVWWTNTSGPFSRVMKPKPFASLNHFTVPFSTADLHVLAAVLSKSSRLFLPASFGTISDGDASTMKKVAGGGPTGQVETIVGRQTILT
jgi:hypothetical protein